MAAQMSSPAVAAPAPTFQDLQATVNQYISQGKWNEAFQHALMANNLQLVVATCESVNPMQLFNQDACPLSQSVLLSLIQQLGTFSNSRLQFCCFIISFLRLKICALLDIYIGDKLFKQKITL
jgi:enhancer of mRNA-decapping protein 4